jgi:addiction module RelE/StbE family toxin
VVKLSWTSTFIKTSKKFFKKHPELKPDFKELLIELEEDPFQKRLKLHQLKGRHKEKYSVSLTYSYRVVLYLEIVNKEIVLLDIGSHDEVY